MFCLSMYLPFLVLSFSPKYPSLHMASFSVCARDFIQHFLGFSASDELLIVVHLKHTVFAFIPVICLFFSVCLCLSVCLTYFETRIFSDVLGKPWPPGCWDYRHTPTHRIGSFLVPLRGHWRAQESH